MIELSDCAQQQGRRSKDARREPQMPLTALRAAASSFAKPSAAVLARGKLPSSAPTGSGHQPCSCQHRRHTASTWRASSSSSTRPPQARSEAAPTAASAAARCTGLSHGSAARLMKGNSCCCGTHACRPSWHVTTALCAPAQRTQADNSTHTHHMGKPSRAACLSTVTNGR
jgi:hypothetical protein